MNVNIEKKKINKEQLIRFRVYGKRGRSAQTEETDNEG